MRTIDDLACYVELKHGKEDLYDYVIDHALYLHSLFGLEGQRSYVHVPATVEVIFNIVIKQMRIAREKFKQPSVDTRMCSLENQIATYIKHEGTRTLFPHLYGGENE